MPVTIGVPPVSSGTEDPFNLSTLCNKNTHPHRHRHSPNTRNVSQRALSSPAKTAHSGFAFETADLTATTWLQVCFPLSLFQRNVTQRETITLQRCTQIRCRFKSTHTFLFQRHWERGMCACKGGGLHHRKEVARTISAFQEHKRIH